MYDMIDHDDYLAAQAGMLLACPNDDDEPEENPEDDDDYVPSC